MYVTVNRTGNLTLAMRRARPYPDAARKHAVMNLVSTVAGQRQWAQSDKQHQLPGRRQLCNKAVVVRRHQVHAQHLPVSRGLTSSAKTAPMLAAAQTTMIAHADPS